MARGGSAAIPPQQLANQTAVNEFHTIAPSHAAAALEGPRVVWKVFFRVAPQQSLRSAEETGSFP
jgi:hypothetical protein